MKKWEMHKRSNFKDCTVYSSHAILSIYATKLGPWKLAFLLETSTLNCSNHVKKREICVVLPSHVNSLTPLRLSGVENDARHPLKKHNSFFNSARNSALDIDGPEIVTFSREFNVVGASTSCICNELIPVTCLDSTTILFTVLITGKKAEMYVICMTSNRSSVQENLIENMIVKGYAAVTLR